MQDEEDRITVFAHKRSAFCCKRQRYRKQIKAGRKFKQWERVFSSPEKASAAGIDKLSDAEKSALQSYLTSHAADSAHPEAAGL